MIPRLDFARSAPDAYKALAELDRAVRASGLERSLVELVMLRVSQLNACAAGIERHARDARAFGETEQRLLLLDAWEDAPVFSERERAALGWAEAATRLARARVPEAAHERARRSFSENELAGLNWAVVAANAWNRAALPWRHQR